MRSFGKQGINQVHLQSIMNLKNLLKGTRQTSASTTYLQRATIEDESANLAAASASQEEVKEDDLEETGAK